MIFLHFSSTLWSVPGTGVTPIIFSYISYFPFYDKCLEIAEILKNPYCLTWPCNSHILQQIISSFGPYMGHIFLTIWSGMCCIKKYYYRAIKYTLNIF